MKYLDRETNLVYNSDTATMLKCCMEVEVLGDGYTRNTMKKVMRKNGADGYFIYYYKVTVDRYCKIFAVQEYIVPVTEEWVNSFRRETPDVWPE